ncbi:protein ORF20 [Anguillid herpesvirus 1]|uniref:Protein ORF20 n=1 Tax=Anguillid herpesvirus 1 TaxID=150286 RepID=A0A1J0RE56_9VIRU|nr:protein ORF20 [Anguillid herpesvirus 1]ADA57783.1 protein ORF20 [Anguillid herpesvirus 1]APD76183.1 ORF20 [Anguillid herpesvirus 1]QRM16315.1 protein ORF20 [Anguillid herpesvirus 1]QRM16445.1 protein ORF20 [Anguillid herpesvirus 1]QRM16574.1 protein ORF20 [Anguillid herpesvirus 1]
MPRLALQSTASDLLTYYIGSFEFNTRESALPHSWDNDRRIMYIRHLAPAKLAGAGYRYTLEEAGYQPVNGFGLGFVRFPNIDRNQFQRMRAQVEALSFAEAELRNRRRQEVTHVAGISADAFSWTAPTFEGLNDLLDGLGLENIASMSLDFDEEEGSRRVVAQDLVFYDGESWFDPTSTDPAAESEEEDEDQTAENERFLAVWRQALSAQSTVQPANTDFSGFEVVVVPHRTTFPPIEPEEESLVHKLLMEIVSLRQALAGTVNESDDDSLSDRGSSSPTPSDSEDQDQDDVRGKRRPNVLSTFRPEMEVEMDYLNILQRTAAQGLAVLSKKFPDIFTQIPALTKLRALIGTRREIDVRDRPEIFDWITQQPKAGTTGTTGTADWQSLQLPGHADDLALARQRPDLLDRADDLATSINRIMDRLDDMRGRGGRAESNTVEALKLAVECLCNVQNHYLCFWRNLYEHYSSVDGRFRNYLLDQAPRLQRPSTFNLGVMLDFILQDSRSALNPHARSLLEKALQVADLEKTQYEKLLFDHTSMAWYFALNTRMTITNVP